MSKRKAKPAKPLGRGRVHRLADGRRIEVFEGPRLGDGVVARRRRDRPRGARGLRSRRCPGRRRADRVLPMLPRVRPLPTPELELARAMLPPGILVGFGIDIGPAITFVTTLLLDRWRVEPAALAAAALANLRAAARRCGPDAVLHDHIADVPVSVVQTGHGIAASLLLVPECLERVLGSADRFLLAPMRDILIALPPTSTASSRRGWRTSGRRWTPTTSTSAASATAGCGHAGVDRRGAGPRLMRRLSQQLAPRDRGRQRLGVAASRPATAAIACSNARRTSSRARSSRRAPASRQRADEMTPRYRQTSLRAARLNGGNASRRISGRSAVHSRSAPSGSLANERTIETRCSGTARPGHRPGRAGPQLVDEEHARRAHRRRRAPGIAAKRLDRPARRRRLGLHAGDERLRARDANELVDRDRDAGSRRVVLDHDRDARGRRPPSTASRRGSDAVGLTITPLTPASAAARARVCDDSRGGPGHADDDRPSLRRR